MECGSKAAMVSEAITLLEDMFSSENESLWLVSVPPTDLRRTATTSTSTPQRPWLPPSRYDVLPISILSDENRVLSSALVQIGKGLLEFVNGRAGDQLLHNTSFWALFFNALLMEMSGGLLIRGGYQRSEADVRQELISPLLKRVAHSMSSFVAPYMEYNEESAAEYASSLIVECNTEIGLHEPGTKPAVDYCLVGRMGDEILYKVPVEAKKTITVYDMGQLASYMGSMGNVGGGNTGIGFLVDETQMKFALAPFSLCDGPPLPIIFLSPSFTWRSGTTLKREACVAICLLQQVLIPRLEVTGEALSTCFDPERWLAIKETADRVALEPPPRDDIGVPHDYMKELESLKREVKELKKEIKALKKDLEQVKKECDHTPRKTPAAKSGTKRRHVE